ncbi:MAG TPA: TRAM domain-containing protein [Acidimicrobiales bacterium]|nr:TRAM domain-containing protein [Acidimicrobiales bacterium]
MTRLEVGATAIVPGGAALARDDDGRVVFVEGALPGERVVAEVVEERKDFRRAVTIDVVDASPERVAPPCGNVALGCGGCGWQHVAVAGQRRLKEEMVADALRRIAKLAADDLPPLRTVELLDAGFRTTVRVAVRDGRPMFHRAGSADLVDATACHVAHPLLLPLLDGDSGDVDYGDASQVVLRASVATGERAALVRPEHLNTSRLRVPVDVQFGRGLLHERIAGRMLQVSIRSFLQSSPQAATALVEQVLAAIERAGPGGIGRMADLYAGVGVFADAVAAATGAAVVAVESDRSSSGDAIDNLAWAGARATVVRSEVGRWRPETHDVPFDLVVADPARPGLGRPGTGTVAAASPRVLVLISCDAASFARDVTLLRDAGYRLTDATLVDAFPHTPHVEIVSVFASAV